MTLWYAILDEYLFLCSIKIGKDDTHHRAVLDENRNTEASSDERKGRGRKENNY